jgi:hypothetical protein
MAGDEQAPSSSSDKTRAGNRRAGWRDLHSLFAHSTGYLPELCGQMHNREHRGTSNPLGSGSSITGQECLVPQSWKANYRPQMGPAPRSSEEARQHCLASSGGSLSRVLGNHAGACHRRQAHPRLPLPRTLDSPAAVDSSSPERTTSPRLPSSSDCVLAGVSLTRAARAEGSIIDLDSGPSCNPASEDLFQFPTGEALVVLRLEGLPPGAEPLNQRDRSGARHASEHSR